MAKKEVYIFSCWNEKGESAFPTRYSTEELLSIRNEIGASDFANLFENRPVSPEDAPFKKESLRYFEKLDKDLSVKRFMALDLGGKTEGTSTPTGIVIVDVDRDQNWYVQYADNIYKDLPDVIDEIFRLYNVWQPIEKIGVEKEKYSIAMMPFLKVEEKQRNITLPIEELKLKINDRIAKKDRILSLQPRVERGQLFIKKEQTKLEDQLLRFPRGNVDIIDALSRISQIAFPPKHRIASKRKEIYDPIYLKIGRSFQQISSNLPK